MQRQPTPRADPLRKGHFLKRCDALKELEENSKFHNDLSDMPSRYVTLSKNANKKQDTEVRKAVKDWDVKRVRAIVQCFHCGKARCIYTGTDDDYSM